MTLSGGTIGISRRMSELRRGRSVMCSWREREGFMMIASWSSSQNHSERGKERMASRIAATLTHVFTLARVSRNQPTGCAGPRSKSEDLRT